MDWETLQFVKALAKKYLKKGTPKFKVGDKVVFKNDPEAKGTISSVDYDPKNNDEPVYAVKLGVGSEMAQESELKRM